MRCPGFGRMMLLDWKFVNPTYEWCRFRPQPSGWGRICVRHIHPWPPVQGRGCRNSCRWCTPSRGRARSCFLAKVQVSGNGHGSEAHWLEGSNSFDMFLLCGKWICRWMPRGCARLKSGKGGRGEGGRGADLKHETDLPYIAVWYVLMRH